ncbi:uncharacterized protein K452DRAFT_285365 [Aplosporella prunicola CBS 121167]|uniref:DNA-directed RNA polymerase subunit n=1 Tax=Aplosporella prunicola CBS 121167 TaxID=1176127 RepID=A0A6A6BMT5_9PEZI|nr:uncharacterized protein K452DRAFT_285365 [Aplosporella prunicola CBS 121167]KAF2144137.1 hypothetical protein K452DRAFT_285365 [Aplosporella prunicola CBS 121167]
MSGYASPAPSDGANERSKKVMFRFCAECSNLLYPKEDESTRQLMFACRTCSYSQDADTACIYRNDMHNTASETAGVTSDLGQDPTLPRAKEPCPKCGEEAVFFQSQQRTAETGMKLYYVCVSPTCGLVWQ